VGHFFALDVDHGRGDDFVVGGGKAGGEGGDALRRRFLVKSGWLSVGARDMMGGEGGEMTGLCERASAEGIFA
jgi:hypothetical protein